MTDHNIQRIHYHRALKRLLSNICKFLFRLLHIFLHIECTAGYLALFDRVDLINWTYHFLNNWQHRYCTLLRDEDMTLYKYIHFRWQLILLRCMVYNHLYHIAHQRHTWQAYKCHWLYDNFRIDSHIVLFYIFNTGISPITIIIEGATEQSLKSNLSKKN